jgi:hypothetical protein
VEYLVDNRYSNFSSPREEPKKARLGRTGYIMKHHIRANTASFGLKLKATATTTKKGILATATFTRKHFGRRGLLLCLLFGVDLRSKYYVDAYSTGLGNKIGATAIAKMK